jgi:uroporphyrinogen-III synthase
MQEHKTTILSTRPVDGALTVQAIAKQIQLEVIPFIETEPLQSVEVQQEIELAATEFATVIFTSMNAVESVTGMLDGEIPEWRIYCIGHKTKELVENYFGEAAVAGSADNAARLADEIIENEDAEEVIFFCGDHRRNELPAKLDRHGIAVNEVTVYQTILTTRKLEKDYDAILFFSPTAVESYFIKNKPAASTIMFAIGDTTKQTIQKYCSNKIIVSALPGKDKLVEQAMAYFEREA